MIVSNFEKQAFFHIPKNGGSTFRDHFLRVWTNPRELNGRQYVESANRTMDLTHITPNEVSQYFGDVFSLDGYQVYIITRDPISRFKSALAQYLKSFHQDDRHFVTASEVEILLRSVDIEKLCVNSNVDYRCIYFRPQSDYYLENNCVSVQLNSANSFFGISDDARVNFTGYTPHWASLLMRGPVKYIYKALGADLKKKLKNTITKRNNQIDILIAEVADINSFFLQDFYSQDFHIHSKSKKC